MAAKYCNICRVERGKICTAVGDLVIVKQAVAVGHMGWRFRKRFSLVVKVVLAEALTL